MIRVWLVAAARALLRQKLCTAINLLGLSSGIAFCVLCLSYVPFERGYDAFHARAESICLLYPAQGNVRLGKRNVGMSYPLVSALAARVPAIRRAVSIREGGDDRVLCGDGAEIASTGGMDVEPPFLEVFTFGAVSGDPSSALRRPNSVVLSRRLAGACFGTADPVGRVVPVKSWGSVSDAVVTAVVDVPVQSSLQFDFLLPLNEWLRHSSTSLSAADAETRQWLLSDQWAGWNYPTFVELAPGWRVPDVEAQMAAVARRCRDRLGSDVDLRLLPLADLHLTPWLDFRLGPTGDPLHGYVLAAIALAVLLTACANYTTLTLALASTRMREIGIHKVLGGTRARLMRHLWGEAALQAAASVALAAELVELILPAFRVLANRDVAIDRSTLAVVLCGAGVLVAFLSGAYPALVLSGQHPVGVLRGRLRFGGRNRVTQALVIAQFAISVLLVVVALVIGSQGRFLHARDLGFDPAHLVVIDTDGLDRQQARETLAAYRRASASDARLRGVSMGDFRFGQRPGGTNGSYEGRDIGLTTFVVDLDFVAALGLRLVEGRDFSAEFPDDATGSILVNASLLREVGLARAVGRWPARDSAQQGHTVLHRIRACPGSTCAPPS
ncbi:MAG: ABC transporter permease [Candidatus Latescibacterota bacterium]